jgi:hypothetical protein
LLNIYIQNCQNSPTSHSWNKIKIKLSNLFIYYLLYIILFLIYHNIITLFTSHLIFCAIAKIEIRPKKLVFVLENN